MRKIVKLNLILFLAFGLFLSWGCSSVANRNVVVTTEQELRNATMYSGVVIFVNNTINIDDEIRIDGAVTIRGSGTITVSNNHRHFFVSRDGHLTLRDNITLTRAEDYTNRGGGIDIISGTLIMYGGRIYNNAAINGGGIRFFSGSELGTFVMRGGEISGNTAEITGGGIFADGGIINLQRGKIHSNTASGHGGISVSTVWGRTTIGSGMQIFDNTPINVHDQESTTFFMRLITPDIYRFAAVVIIALIGVFVSSTRQKRKQQKTPTPRPLSD